MPHRRLIALIVACALFMQNLDSTVLGTALPAIGRSFNVDPLTLHQAMTAYLISLAVFMPISGWMADRFGARRVFCIAIVIFTVASIACRLSSGVSSLIVARVVQGVGGAMMVPVARLVLVRNVPKAELLDAMAWVTMPALVGPVLGPLIGGFLVTYATWHWIFWINIPFGIIAITMALMFIKEVREENVPPLDIPGFAMCGFGIAAVVFGLENISEGMIPLKASIVLTLLGIAVLALYVRHALRVPNPLIDVRLLKVETFRASVVGGTIFRVGVGALPFLLPMLMQLGFGKNAFESGAVTFSAAAGALMMKAGVSRILNRWGFRKVMIYNSVFSGLSMAACALFSPSTPYWLMVGILLIGGLFRSLQFTSINTVAFADLPQTSLSNATSFTSMGQQLSLSMGIALGAALLNLATFYSGAALTTADFAPAFIVIGLVSGSTAFLFTFLHRDAGAEMSGRTVRAAGPSGAMGATPPPPIGRMEQVLDND